MVETPCPLCGEARARPFARGDDMRYGIGGGFTLVACAACDLVYLNPRPDEDEASRWYPPRYHQAWAEDPPEAGVSARRPTDLACRLFPRPGRLLDVGCGIGSFVAAMRERGWDAEGTEVAEEAAHIGRRRFGVPIRMGPLRALGLPRERYDLITLWHVLEHLADPVGELREVAALLAPGGHALVATPNIQSLSARLFGRWWYHLDLPRHQVLPSIPVMRRLARAAGLEPVAFSSALREHNLAAWAMSLGRVATGWRRRPGAPGGGSGKAGAPRPGKGGKDAVFRLLRLLAWPAVACEQLAGRPATYEVVLRKRGGPAGRDARGTGP
jgi:SAM-dependent methyltransferase